MTLARSYKAKINTHVLDIEKKAVQRYKDWDNERTWWIFEDGSAIGLDSYQVVCIDETYGLDLDNEQLR